MKRRDFIGLAVTAAATAATGEGRAPARPNAGGPRSCAAAAPVPPRNRQPYSDVDWDHVVEVHSTTHGHCTSQQMLDGYLDRGFGLLTLSNYYPSAPYVPAAKMTKNYYRVHNADIPVMVNGKRTDGPFDWSKIISAWADELPPELRRELPFAEGGKLFKPLPEGVLEAPNAEHHGFTDSPMHMCSPGSAFASGTFDARDRFKTRSHGYHFGTGEPWRTSVSRMIDGLIHPDGGGVTINHPAWSNLLDAHVWEVLDYDPRVLGIEVYNQTCAPRAAWRWSKAYCEDYWDRALSTGRQCFGFFVPDWGVTEGVNVLLVPEKSVHACLRAYRQGNFYGAVKGRGMLRFTSIRFDGARLRVTLDKPARIQLITKQGLVKTCGGKTLDFAVSPAERERHGYLRVRAFTLGEADETIFSQPIMLT